MSLISGLAKLNAWHHRPNLVRLRVFGMCFAFCGATVVAAQEASDQSLARIRERLQQPSTLDLNLPKADFTVYVEGRRPLDNVFEQPPWVTVPEELAAPKIGTGGVNDVGLGHNGTIVSGGIDPGVIGHAISRKIRNRAAHAEVQRAIAEYCSAHREEPGADKICQ